MGKRISIRHTRALLTAALNGALLDVEYYTDPIFGFEVPASAPDVPSEVLRPAKSWPSEEEYWNKYKQLAARFVSTFKKYAPDTPEDVAAAGPKI